MNYLERVREILRTHGFGYFITDLERANCYDLLAQAIADIDRWVSVEERLPTDMVDYFAGYKSGEYTRYRYAHYCVDAKRWYDSRSGFLIEDAITHWQEITAPKGEK